jgi:hypothetical protein
VPKEFLRSRHVHPLFEATSVAEDVSESVNCGSAVFPAGPLTSEAVTVRESPTAPRNETVATADVAVAVSAVVCAAVAADKVRVSAFTVADEGATERTPRPNPATAISAMRLNVVFEDIIFLSVVDLRTIRSSA